MPGNKRAYLRINGQKCKYEFLINLKHLFFDLKKRCFCIEKVRIFTKKAS